MFFDFHDVYFTGSYMKICHRSDPQLNKCMKESFEKLRPFLVKGKDNYFGYNIKLAISRAVHHNDIDFLSVYFQ